MNEVYMDPQKLKMLIEEAVRNAISFSWWIYLAIAILSAFGAFLGSYLKEKARNLATKEDIENITEKIEKIRSQYTAEVEILRASLQLSNQLKLAALDERLKKHQEAYTLWLGLIWNLNDDAKIGQCIQSCQDWWNANCLYLGDAARRAFKTAYLLAANFRELQGEHAGERRKWFDTISEAGKEIIEGVSLPSLGEDEVKRPEQNKES